MKPLDETTALAILFANTKRKRRTEDLVTVAEAFQFLVDKYGSVQAVAKKVGLSPEMVREFLAILSLSPQVLDMVRRREIDSLDVAYRLSKISDPDSQLELAVRAQEMRSKDIRDVEREMATSGRTVDEAVESVKASSLADLHIFVLDFEEEHYKEILSRARSAGTKPAELLKKVILEWLGDDSAV